MDELKNANSRVCITRKELPEYLGCGIYTADRIAKKSGARVQVGRRVLIYLPKIEQYIRHEVDM